MVFDGKVEWSFDKDYARNVRTFGVDNSSLCDADNLKNNLLVLGEGNTFGINGSFGAPEEKFSIYFSKANTKQSFARSYIIMLIIVICLLMEKKCLNLNFPTQFCPGSISNGFSATESREVSINGNVYDFLVDYNLLINLTYKNSQVFN